MRHKFIRNSIWLVLVMVIILSGCTSSSPSAGNTAPAAISTATSAASPPTLSPTLSPTPSPSRSPLAPTPTPTAAVEGQKGHRLEGLIIGVDAGHQDNIDYGQEPIAPGSAERKIKATVGTSGINTKTPEYVVNLNVALKLQALLESEGATVVMTRTTHSVNLSNIDRAEIFNEAKTDLAVRLHCNGMTDTSLHGAFIIQPAANPYLKECQNAAQCILDAYIKETGFYDKGVYTFDNQTGFNWCERAIICVEMGHLTNTEDEKKLVDTDFQSKIAQGIFDGILEYFVQRQQS